MSTTPETDAAWECDHPLHRLSDPEKRELCARMQRERDEATERIQHAEILLGDLAGGYWRTTLNDQDPSGEGIMGERVQQYWARYSENTTVEARDQ